MHRCAAAAVPATDALPAPNCRDAAPTSWSEHAMAHRLSQRSELTFSLSMPDGREVQRPRRTPTHGAPSSQAEKRAETAAESMLRTRFVIWRTFPRRSPCLATRMATISAGARRSKLARRHARLGPARRPRAAPWGRSVPCTPSRFARFVPRRSPGPASDPVSRLGPAQRTSKPCTGPSRASLGTSSASAAMPPSTQSWRRRA